MNMKSLIPGLELASEYNLTQREIEVLIPFLIKSYNTSDLAEKINAHKTTLHHIIQRLKLKNVIVLKDRDKVGNNLYEFNKEILRE